MADNITLPPASGKAATRDVTYSGEAAHAQAVGLLAFSGSDDAKTAVDLPGDGTNGLDVDVTRLPALVEGTANIGDVDVLTVPADPFGANADASSATGSISAMLKYLAAGIAGATSLPAGTNNIGDVDVLTVPSPLSSAGNGTAAAALRVTLANDSTGIVALTTGSAAIGKLTANSGVDIGDVDVTSIIPGTGATNLGKAEDAQHTSGDVGVMLLGVRNVGHAAVSGTDMDYSPINVDGEGCVVVVGNVAHDATDADPPHKIGARAIAGLSTATLVVATDRTNLYAGLDGALIVRNHCGLEDIVSGTASNTDGARFSVIASSGAGVRTYLTQVSIANTSTAMITCSIDDGTTPKYVLPVPAQGGVTVSFDPPIPGTAATAWQCDPSAANTTTDCSMVGFKSKV